MNTVQGYLQLDKKNKGVGYGEYDDGWTVLVTLR